MTTCWNCKETLDPARMCANCGVLLPLPRAASHFALFGLPERLTVDGAELERLFHELSRRNHPDRFRKGPARERMIALENISRLNEAYRSLKDPLERAAYLIRLKRGDAPAVGASPPSELFEEILEIQEELGEYRFADGDEKQVLGRRLSGRRDDLARERDERTTRLTEDLFASWDATDSEPRREEILNEMAAILGARGYLNRMLDSLHAALEGSITR